MPPDDESEEEVRVILDCNANGACGRCIVAGWSKSCNPSSSISCPYCLSSEKVAIVDQKGRDDVN